MKSIFKKVRGKYKRIVSNSLPRYFIRTSWASSVYYFFFSSKFRRERHAVLVGKVKHLTESKQERANLYTLIRNTHRLEKGLLMRPRRDIFGLDFIKETVDNFETLYNQRNCNDSGQLKWSMDVLSEYFDKTGDHPILDKQRNRFRSIRQTGPGYKQKNIPYIRNIENKPEISYEAFYKLTKYRRSVRWFEDCPVPHDLIDKAILAANQSPSACNRQPFEYRVIDDPKLLKEVAGIPMGIKGYEHNIPMMIVAVGNLDAYFDERDRHVIYIDASLANMTLMLALETLGLSSCPINWPDIEALEKRMEKALNLSGHQRPIMCMAVGYPDPEGMVAFSEKRSIDEIRKYN